jgi:NitT/TauT family transport system ATP-binding protein
VTVYDIVLECRGVHHWFRDLKVLYDVNLRVVRGETVALVGPSGCGKSTLLRAILGTHPPRSGQILMNGQPVTQPGRDRGIVYQRYALFPYMTARENVAFGLVLEHSSVWERMFRPWRCRALYKQHLKAAAEQLDKVRLSHALDMYPAQMSGGMCQRVAIAQALIMRPQILLLDEPFGALDEATREEQQELLLLLYQENLAAKRAGAKPPYTMIIVTHELNEALYVSDRVVAVSQSWLWEEEKLPRHPGATVVYDAAAPPFPRNPETRSEDFFTQRSEIRRVAFEPTFRPKRTDFLRFWDECQRGKGVGIMRPVPSDATNATVVQVVRQPGAGGLADQSRV